MRLKDKERKIQRAKAMAQGGNAPLTKYYRDHLDPSVVP